MIPESFQVPVLAAAIIALISFVVIPAVAVNDRIVKSSFEASDVPDGASCALPPALDIQEGDTDYKGGPLPIDEDTGLSLETATFALG